MHQSNYLQKILKKLEILKSTAAYHTTRGIVDSLFYGHQMTVRGCPLLIVLTVMVCYQRPCFNFSALIRFSIDARLTGLGMIWHNMADCHYAKPKNLGPRRF